MLSLDLGEVDDSRADRRVGPRRIGVGRRARHPHRRPHADGPPLHADQLRLQQVLDNLLSNAVKFSGDGSRVTITATHDGRAWRIDVADQGIGIPPADVDQLFNRFVRASNAAAAGLQGTGLGLSIVKAITELHGGRVEVRSTLGSGTTFSVYLPVSP